MSGSWQEVRVGDLVRDAALAVGDGYRMRNEELGRTGIPFVRGGDIGDGSIEHRTIDHIREEFRDRVAAKLTQPWDVAFITKGTVGRVGILRPEQPSVVFAPQVAHWRSLDTSRLDPRFLYYLLRGPEFQANLDAVKTHGAMAADYVSISQQHGFTLRLAPIDQQRRIASILGALDDKIELNRRTNETLEELARSIFKSWFVDFDPVRAKAQGMQPVGMDAETAALFPSRLVESELGEVPERWRAAPLSEWATALSGGTPSKSDASLWGGDLPWISPKVMTAIHADETDAFVTAAALGNGTRLAPSGSTLVMVRGMGLHKEVRVSQARRDVTFNQDVKALVPRGIEPTLLLFALLDAQPTLLGRVQSSGHGTGVLPSDILLAQPLALPPLDAQKKLVTGIEAMNDRIEAARCESRTLAELRDLLLPKLISGDLRIPTAEKMVEAAL